MTDAWTLVILAAAAFLAGALNSIAGGGTLLTFPALTAVVSPAVANATSTIALFPGSIAGSLGYRAELAPSRRFLKRMLLPSVLGGFVGAWLVGQDQSAFAVLVPWLILTAALLFVGQAPVARWLKAHKPDHEPGPRGQLALVACQFLIAVYGGYFGAGIGILMLTTLGFMGVGDIHRMNAVKTFLAAAINGATVIVFIHDGLVNWELAAPMVVSAVLGGYTGARVARRLPVAVVRYAVIVIGFSLAAFYFIRPAPPAGGWEKLPPLPDREGFAGSFAGVSGDALLVAGGANFPGQKPWEGGAKAWTDAVFVLDAPAGEWKNAGTLPRPLGYGASATYRGSIACAGGSDATRHYADAFRLEWKDGRLHTSPLPPLPKAVANGGGALVGDVLYVVGGQDAPDGLASKAVFSLDLSAAEPRWVTAPDLPASRILATAAAFDETLYVVGGAELVRDGDRVTRRYLRDGYRLDAAGWKQIADLPHPVVAAPALLHRTGFDLLGGDDGTQLHTPPDRHPGFSRMVLRYDAAVDRWAPAGEVPAPRVTVPCVRWRDRWVVPSGEARPGVRSPEVWAFR
ncbi:TSUP family transporter [bacterium]|nr:TSUP family transporter [bacterium]